MLIRGDLKRKDSLHYVRCNLSKAALFVTEYCVWAHGPFYARIFTRTDILYKRLKQNEVLKLSSYVNLFLCFYGNNFSLVAAKYVYRIFSNKRPSPNKLLSHGP